MQLLQYSNESFVDRETEVALVTNRISQMLPGQTEPPRMEQPQTIVFQGERGSGKTWLCFHLKRSVVAKIAGARTALISLAPKPDGYQIEEDCEWFLPAEAFSPEVTVLKIAEVLTKCFETTTAVGASLLELGQWLPRDLGRRKETVFVLFLDSAFEANWHLLELLEQHLLASLAALPNVLIVITGRGKPFLWTSPKLRIEVTNLKLKPFDLELVREQLRRQGRDPALAGQIYSEGGGHPLSTYLLAGYEQPARLNYVVEELLAVLPSRQDRHDARELLEALCVLDGFVEDDIAPMSAARLNDSEIEQWSMREVRRKRDLLVRTQLVRWQDSYFRLDDALRTAMLAYLQIEAEPGLWQRLQEKAVDLFVKRARDYAQQREFFCSLAEQHCRQLQRTDAAAKCREEIAQVRAPRAAFPLQDRTLA